MLARITSLAALALLLLSSAFSTMAAVDSRRHDTGTGVDTFHSTEVYPRYENGTHMETLEDRSPAAIASIALEGVNMIISGIQGAINADKDARGKFTSSLVSEMRKKYPKFNWVVCHTKHETKFNGKKGKDWDHRHQEFDIKLGGTVGYEIYNLGSGEFIRKGDGGFLNWAYIGNVASKSGDGKKIKFNKP
ncbi:hypothetical protein BDN71DRAFT_535967 [Pleurotus eryngii]|uniref:DUF7888 domain-containing protein n=1 Tax=Pleurotus eryngii TaxID=5323 RepID=A0A9P6DHR9_PLEER|nr:hypothetical protein BDN71DRAFT_535967 [Pleurotus eryngii]